MKIKFLIILFFVCSSSFFASEHGIYLRTNKITKGNFEQVKNQIANGLKQTDFKILKSMPVHTPDYVREDKEEHCGLNAWLFILTSSEYSQMLTSYGTKYLVAGFIKIALYETPEGINVVISDPETINRIVFNDMYENDHEDLYKEVITKTIVYKKSLVSFLHNTLDGNVEEIMEPIRDDEDLAESSKDMFMMVGSLTLFNDEDQFPIIYSTPNSDGMVGLNNLKDKFEANLKAYIPSEDDIEYRWYPKKNDLEWKIISEIVSPKNDAILLGITRPRTEAVSFNIAGASREDGTNMCPGIDHAPAYPIEVLLIQEEDQINVYTQREMHRMDMYFWDAGMSAFMDHMSMPGILDDSIKEALLGKEYIED